MRKGMNYIVSKDRSIFKPDTSAKISSCPSDLVLTSWRIQSRVPSAQVRASLIDETPLGHSKNPRPQTLEFDKQLQIPVPQFPNSETLDKSSILILKMDRQYPMLQGCSVDLWECEWQSTPVFLPGESYGQRSLVGYSPLVRKRVGHDLVTKQQKTTNTKLTQGTRVTQLISVDCAKVNWMSGKRPNTPGKHPLSSWVASMGTPILTRPILSHVKGERQPGLTALHEGKRVGITRRERKTKLRS